MTTWTSDEPDKIAAAEELQIASARRDGTLRHQGRIWAGGVEKDVTFVDATPDINDQIDAEYRTKYRRYAANIIRSIVSPEARSTTIKLVPH